MTAGLIEIKAVLFKDNVQLFDIFINGVWQGSKRTKEQAEEYIKWLQGHRRNLDKGENKA